MKRLELKRVSECSDVTMGVLIDMASGIPLMVTLELPDKQNRQSISCIPKGAYICAPYSSGRHKNVYEVRDVGGRSAILFHIGNTVADIRGCILVGSEYGELNAGPAVLESTKAFKKLQGFIGDESFELIVT